MFLWAFIAITALAADPPSYTRYAPCDIPAPALPASAPAPDVDACEQLCTSTAGCGAYTFVSGWNRCRLHADAPVHIAVRIHAATFTELANAGDIHPAPRGLGATEPDHDNNGKDLETAPRDLPDAAACADACRSTSACRGFSYVEGYRSCWLKRTDGELVPKTFACGVRTP